MSHFIEMPVLADMKNGTQKFSLTRAQRAKIICMMFLFPVGVVSFVVVALIVGRARVGLDGFLDLALYGFAPCLIMFGLFVCAGVRHDWFGATFLINQRGITKVLPSGSRVEGEWEDLLQVLPEGIMRLVFKSGPVIWISGHYRFYDELIQAAVNASGGSAGLFPAALAAAEKRRRERKERWRAQSSMEVGRLYLYVQLLPAGLLLSSGVYWSLGITGFSKGLLYWGLALSPLLWGATFFGIRLWARYKGNRKK